MGTFALPFFLDILGEINSCKVADIILKRLLQRQHPAVSRQALTHRRIGSWFCFLNRSAVLGRRAAHRDEACRMPSQPHLQQN
jgi:hypothetical protein